jgi:hypothetical protein
MVLTAVCVAGVAAAVSANLRNDPTTPPAAATPVTGTSPGPGPSSAATPSVLGTQRLRGPVPDAGAQSSSPGRITTTPATTSPVAAPTTSPVAVPTTSPVAVPTTSPVTSPVTSPAVTTAPVTGRVFGLGAVRLLPASGDVRPELSRSGARRRALADVDAGVGRGDLELTFGMYLDPGTLTEPGGTVVAQERPVWVAHFRGVRRRRASNIPERSRLSSTRPPTTARELLTDVVVVIDDRSGRVLLRSEFASIAATRPGR